MPQATFKSLFCQKFGCPPAEYEERAFRKCLYWHGRILAPVVRTIKRDFFLEDFKFIRYLGDSLGVREATVDVKNYNDVNRASGSWLRTDLKIRVSGRKANRLLYQLFQEAREADAVPSTR
jgi:hypothetical protein